MTRDEHLYTIASEECVELAQRFSKALRFGPDQIQPSGGDGLHPDGGNPERLNNRARILFEYAHLVTAMRMLGFDIPRHGYIEAWAEQKRAKVERFLKYSEECGTLQEASR